MMVPVLVKYTVSVSVTFLLLESFMFYLHLLFNILALPCFPCISICRMNCSPNLVQQAMLFLSFDDDRIEAFKSQFYEAAKQYGEKNISFLIGDVTDAQGALQVIFNL